MTEKVLIIDDDTDTLRLVRLMLQHQGYEISTASSGPAGIAKANEEHPDVILLDVMMPGMDGYQVCGQLKRNPATSDIPVLFLTALTDEESEVRALAARALGQTGDIQAVKPLELALQDEDMWVRAAAVQGPGTAT